MHRLTFNQLKNIINSKTKVLNRLRWRNICRNIGFSPFVEERLSARFLQFKSPH
jgi:hypothetical protein